MFDTLLSWLGSLRDWMDWLWRELWRQVTKVFTSLWGVGLVVVGWLYTACKWVGDCVQEIAGAIDQITFPTINHGPGPMSQAMAIANTFLPLTELCAFVVAYIALRLALTVYRLIKSWLPTLS